jgi:hypothetical protein
MRARGNYLLAEVPLAVFIAAEALMDLIFI